MLPRAAIMGASVAVIVLAACLELAPTPPGRAAASEVDRSPVDLVLTPDERWLLTANQTAGTIALVEVATGKVVAELPCGTRPAAVALTPDGKRALVTAQYSGELTVFDVAPPKLTRVRSLHLGFEPRGIAIAPAGRRAYVALGSGSSVAVIDLDKFTLLDKIDVGQWPRHLALSPDGKRLAVGVNAAGGVAVVDTATHKLLFVKDFLGLNLGQMQVSADGRHVYFPWMVYRDNPITTGNIRLGWVLASRIARVRLDELARRETLSLDPQGKAVADPTGLALSPDEQTLVCAASGTQELLVYRLNDLPFYDTKEPDHIPPELLKDAQRFRRIPLGGRPMFVRFARDGRRVFVANYLLNAVQVVDLARDKVVQTIALGGPGAPSRARQGEAIFYDARRSLDQWYSCHSCHFDGHTNSVSMDTRNDGRNRSFKTVLSLRDVTKTGPWTWHGWQEDLDAAMIKSIIDTMLGPKPSAEDTQALVAFLAGLGQPPNPYRQADGSLSEPARRGQAVFKTAGCARCHPAPYFTDGRVHDVGLGKRGDIYKGFNPPSLLGVHDRPRLLHDGRATSLREVLTGPHAPKPLTGHELSEQELTELIAYLRSL